MIDRRTVIAGALAAAAAPFTARAEGQVSRITAYAFSFPALESGDIRLAEYTGHPFLVVNTASQCGYTPQYAGLQQLWTEFHGRGLTIIGVPSNDFGGQEPGGPKEIAADRATRICRYLPDRGQGGRARRRRPSLLQMGGASAADRCPEMELP